MSEFSLKSINQTGMIITLSREIETLMTKLGATTAGLHDKTDYLAPKLSEECIKLLHYIAAVRNKNAHEVINSNDDFDMEFFTESCELVMNELKELLPADEQDNFEVKTAIQIDSKNDIDVERSLSVELRLFFRITAFIPLVNIIYFCFCMLRTMVNAISKLIGVLFFLISIIIVTGSILKKDYQTMYIGLILFGIIYIYGVVLALIERKQNIKFNKFAYMPILNFGYFIYGSVIKIKLFKFIYFLILIGCYVAGLIYYFKFENMKLAFYFLTTSYLVGILTAIFDRVTVKKEL